MDKRSIGFKEQVDSTRPRESCQAKVRRLPSAATVFWIHPAWIAVRLN